MAEALTAYERCWSALVPVFERLGKKIHHVFAEQLKQEYKAAFEDGMLAAQKQIEQNREKDKQPPEHDDVCWLIENVSNGGCWIRQDPDGFNWSTDNVHLATRFKSYDEALCKGVRELDLSYWRPVQHTFENRVANPDPRSTGHALHSDSAAQTTAANRRYKEKVHSEVVAHSAKLAAEFSGKTDDAVDALAFASASRGFAHSCLDGPRTKRYGQGTLHKTEHLNVETDEGGNVVAVWFRCLALPFEQSDATEARADEMNEMYAAGRIPRLVGIDYLPAEKENQKSKSKGQNEQHA